MTSSLLMFVNGEAQANGIWPQKGNCYRARMRTW